MKYLLKRTAGYTTKKVFAFGSAYHHGSEIYYERGLDREAGIEAAKNYIREWTHQDYSGYKSLIIAEKNCGYDEAVKIMEQDIKLVEAMLNRLFDTYERFGIEFEATELEMDHVFGNGARYKGFVDGVVLMDGKRYLMELKSAANIQTGHLDVDFQTSIYLAIFKKLYDLELDGCLWISNKKAIPKEPKRLRGGGVSTAQNQATTPELYEKALIEAYGSVEDSPEKNQKYLGELIAKGTEFISVRIIEKPDHILERYYRMFEQAAGEQEAFDKRVKEDGFDKVASTVYCVPSAQCVTFCDYSKQCKEVLLSESI